MTKLSPCPFCGEKAKYIERSTHKRDRNRFDIGCDTIGCYLEGGAEWWLTKSEITEKWNRRTLCLT